MSNNKKWCDVCGGTYKLPRFANYAGKVDVPYRYKIWNVLPTNKRRVGFVKKDLCPDCVDNLETALKLLKQEQMDE